MNGSPTILTIDEMRRLVSSNGTGWKWQDKERSRGFITTQEGCWQFDEDRQVYTKVHKD